MSSLNIDTRFWTGKFEPKSTEAQRGSGNSARKVESTSRVESSRVIECLCKQSSECYILRAKSIYNSAFDGSNLGWLDEWIDGNMEVSELNLTSTRLGSIRLVRFG